MKAAPLVLLAAAALLALPASAQQVTLALPAVNLGFAPAYVAADKGFWARQGLKVDMPVITGIGSMNAVLAKSAQFSISSGLTIIRANVRGQKVVQIAETYDGLLEELVVDAKAAKAAGLTLASPLQKRVQFLKGRKIAVASPNALPHGYLRLLARKGGLDPDRDLQVAIMQPQAAAAALKGGAIDGFVETLPQPLEAVERGYGTLLSSGIRGGADDHGDFPELAPLALNGVMTRADYCAANAPTCEKMVRGIAEALGFIHEHPRQSAQLLLKRIPGMNRDVFDKAFAIWLKGLPPSARMDDQRFAHAQQIMIDGGMIKPGERLASFQGIYTNQYVP